MIVVLVEGAPFSVVGNLSSQQSRVPVTFPLLSPGLFLFGYTGLIVIRIACQPISSVGSLTDAR